MSSAQDTRDVNGDELVDGLNSLNVDDERLGADGEPLPKTDEEYAETQLTLRAIVSSKEAGVIIGKGGKNVADLRDETGVKAGVSKVVQGVHDRVLTVAGGCEAISKAYAIVAKALLEGAPQMGMGGVVSNNGTHRKFHCLISWPLLTLFSYQTFDFSQPDGYDHWPSGSQDQAHSRCLGCSYGCAEGDVTAIDGAHCRGAGGARRNSEGSLGDLQMFGG
jgi:hypothetical protein